MKKKNPFHFRTRMSMNPTDTPIILLDSDSESENFEVHTIDESDAIDSEIEIITVDDSNVNQSGFEVDRTLDFIPIHKTPLYNKPKRTKKRRYFDAIPDVAALKKPRLTRRILRSNTTAFNTTSNTIALSAMYPSPVTTAVAHSFVKKNNAKCNRRKRNEPAKNKKSKVTGKLKKFPKKVTKKVKPKSAKNETTKSKIPRIQLSHTNIHNVLVTPRVAGGLRPIIIDGCNVAYGFGNGKFQSRGIILVIDYFKKRGHEEIVSFLPNSYRFAHGTENESKQIRDYEKENIVTYTPSRRLNGKLIKPYDDRFIIQYASEREGVIISNDGYSDLIDEESSWRTTIEQRIINFTFARGLLMLPKDPLGPKGPTLDEMLRFPST